MLSLADDPQGPGPQPGVLGEVATALADVRQRFRLRIPGVLDGPAAVNLANHNVVFKLAVPSTGPFDPRAVFTYNSLARCQPAPTATSGVASFEQRSSSRAKTRRWSSRGTAPAGGTPIGSGVGPLPGPRRRL